MAALAALIAQILLTVLKAVLFLLLAVMLFIILVLCLVLFTPLKYNIYAEKYDTARAEGRISWLLGIIKVSFLYDNGENSYKLKIFGADYKKLTGFFAKFSRKKKEYKLEAAESPVQNKDKNRKDNYEEKKETKNFPQEEEKHPLNKDKTPFKENKAHKDEGKAPEKEKAGMAKKDKKTDRDSKHSGTGKDKRPGSRITNNIRLFWEKVKALPLKAKDIFNKIKENIKTFKEKTGSMEEKFHRVKEFILSEVTKNMLNITKDKIFYLIKKIKPRRIKSDIVFGTGDPCQTGYITGIFAVYMAMSGTVFNITPDFENKILKGRLSVSGHIRASSLAFAVLRVIISNEWKSFYKEAVKIKEEF